MANELALILKSPVEELMPKMIAWNNAELLARVEATLEQYKGVTYDDSQIATAKADRAQLNAICKALNDERIRIGKARPQQRRRLCRLKKKMKPTMLFLIARKQWIRYPKSRPQIGL